MDRRWRASRRACPRFFRRPYSLARGILECAEPDGIIGKMYGVYFHRVLPKVGTAISGVKGAYAYLPASVERFPRPDEMIARMRAAGFREASWTPYTFGTAGLYRGLK